MKQNKDGIFVPVAKKSIKIKKSHIKKNIHMKQRYFYPEKRKEKNIDKVINIDNQFYNELIEGINLGLDFGFYIFQNLNKFLRRF